jgi:cell division protein FtsW (lipid II flippase)
MLKEKRSGRPVRHVLAGVLLMVPVVAYLWVSSYAKASPRVAGFPFFYWWQLLWLVITVVLMGVAYFLVRDER